METLKFSIDVNVNISFDKNTSGLFSNAVNAALAGILSGPRCHCNAPTIEPAEKVAEKPAEKVAEKPATTTVVSIEDVRKALASKVNEHRQEIKEKLEELGAPSVTKLDPSKYEEMYNYLTSL
jgi:hypothetical protein